MSFNRVLIVDDDHVFLRNTKRLLETHDYWVETTGNPTEVLNLLLKNQYHCILIDVKMPAMNGLEVLKLLRENDKTVPVIMISGESTIHIAVEALKIGAYDFIEKPIEVNLLLNAINNAIEKARLLEENKSFYFELQKNFQIIGLSKNMHWILDMINKASQIDSKVLITGESGTGKSLVAHTIHYKSLRKGKPFIEINCAAIPANLLESELFGHKKGTFTGAIKDQKGKFWAANGGTIFLDEIGDMDFNMQAKLLNVLQEQKIQIIGVPEPLPIDVRVIAATNRNLEEMVKKRQFREDLYYRLNVIHIHIPPLRERREDILPIAYHLLKKYANKFNKAVLRIHPLLESILENHSWPGNVRELENMIERLVVFAEGEEITIDDYLNISKIDGFYWGKIMNIKSFLNLNYQQAMEVFEYKFLNYVLEQNEWNVQRSAKYLGIDRSNLYKKLRKFKLSKKAN